jgi:hypothetical protein
MTQPIFLLSVIIVFVLFLYNKTHETKPIQEPVAELSSLFMSKTLVLQEPSDPYQLLTLGCFVDHHYVCGYNIRCELYSSNLLSNDSFGGCLDQAYKVPDGSSGYFLENELLAYSLAYTYVDRVLWKEAIEKNTIYYTNITNIQVGALACYTERANIIDRTKLVQNLVPIYPGQLNRLNKWREYVARFDSIRFWC